MVTRKKSEKLTVEDQNEKQVSLKTNNPLIFISHDTRDAELAEEFSNLLKSASSGALKSFVSSDKKGTRGIEYGLEWYPAIMDKIDEASEVICLLTQQSVERPWILYEAGVAKGKLGKKVIGIAMGIQHSVAFTGPFAQFQNNDGSVDAITKLVIDLVKKVPGLDPDQKLVGHLVSEFHAKAMEIIAQNQKKPGENKEESSEKFVVKLFEEVKIMFESLPSRIEDKIDPDGRKKRRKFNPRILHEIMHLGLGEDKNDLSFIMLLGFLREDFPWLYDLGREVHKGIKSEISNNSKKELFQMFEMSVKKLGHPMMMDIYGKPEESFIFFEEISHILLESLDRMMKDNPRKKVTFSLKE